MDRAPRDRHGHPEYWTEAEQHRYEDRVARELRDLSHQANGRMDRLSAQLDALSRQLLMMMGGLILLAFLLPIVAPFIRATLGGAAP